LARSPHEKIWVVRPGDGATVLDIVKRAGEAASAVAEGRVFVGKKRATRPDQAVSPGDAVRIGRGPAPAGAKRAATPEPEILLHEAGLVACVKPAGLPTVPDRAGAAHALVALVASKIGRAAGDLRITSRLDRDVSGVVVFALDAAAEERLKAARAEGSYRRRYVALAAMRPERPLAEGGVWEAPIGRAAEPHLRRARGPDAKEATTRWRRIATATAAGAERAPISLALLAVDPVTGRTHQIRVHASDAGAPLVGDRDYGGPTRIVLPNGGVLSPARIALHAARIVVPGPEGPIEARAPVPAELLGLWASVGGDADAWTQAVEAPA
jgi:23S rRNA-/tRNA-specific pseudouridylate synthase